jgi:hypothetical protein
MSEEKVNMYRDTAQYLKDTPVLDTKAGILRLVEFAVIDLQFQYGCYVEWKPTPATQPDVGCSAAGGASPSNQMIRISLNTKELRIF